MLSVFISIDILNFVTDFVKFQKSYKYMLVLSFREFFTRKYFL